MNPKKEITALSEETLLLKEWEKRLGETGVPLDEWGKGEAKTLDYLVGEISRGSAIMCFDEEREIWVRELKAVEVRVFYDSPDGTTYILKEDRQVFKDGRVRKRGFSWVAEKIEENENGLIAAERAIREELDLLSPFVSGPKHIENEVFEQESRSYPGLVTEYSIGRFEVYLTPEQFVPEGYVEEQENLTTFFVWEKMMEDIEGK